MNTDAISEGHLTQLAPFSALNETCYLSHGTD